MNNKVFAGVMLVVAVACGLIFAQTAFMHGYASGMRNLGRDPMPIVFGAGAVVCLVVSVVLFVKKRS